MAARARTVSRRHSIRLTHHFDTSAAAVCLTAPSPQLLQPSRSRADRLVDGTRVIVALWYSRARASVLTRADQMAAFFRSPNTGPVSSGRRFVQIGCRPRRPDLGASKPGPDTMALRRLN